MPNTQDKSSEQITNFELRRRMFDKAIEIILKHEGGYVNDPDDPGGETKFGITKRNYPTLNIKSLTVEQVKEIYRRDYWDGKCDWIPTTDIGEEFATIFFDTVVNMGFGKATLLLQQTINRFRSPKADRSSLSSTKIIEDGRLGRITQEETIRFLSDAFIDKFILERIHKYVRIIKRPNKRRANEKFLLGWVNRVLSYVR